LCEQDKSSWTKEQMFFQKMTCWKKREDILTFVSFVYFHGWHWTVTFTISRLNFEIVGSISSKVGDSHGMFISKNTFYDPVDVIFCMISGIEHKVS
jgi:hypothetical protein